MDNVVKFKENVLDLYPHPYIRFLARLVDLILLSFFCSLLLFYLKPHFSEIDRILYHTLYGMSILGLWFILETILLSLFGTTPGKLLLNIKIKSPEKEGKINFSCFLKRSFLVWMVGCGFGIPFISLIFLIASRADLVKNGAASWDESTGLVVYTCSSKAFLRIIIALIIIIIPILAHFI